ncbi:hypothetical protein O3G_MSEX011177 [Manduca sexta]|uniref:Uncharacterized protein n=1 Tax=Manduca sexta TaxID=7130 RepID=A0A922CUQ3_MANSE|nr:hypothetical protein O3G_MSEX011177 [Manduca sexta]
MPEERKGQRNPKEQRRRGRRQEQNAEKKVEKAEPPKVAPKVTEPQKPVHESPGPEFYKSLKRETDEILKITEEESTKYKKKEIQSNWSKYEMPIETYEEIEEQENMGADYETLIQASLSVGGHFQFKHEKSWDTDTGPTPYDKYFEINMDNLNLALSSIPFYERNVIDQTLFNETDILTMNNRATRYKQKYFNDKSYTTPEIEAQEKILQSLKDDNKTTNSEIEIQEKILDNLKDNFSKTDLDTEVVNVNVDQEIENDTLISKDFTAAPIDEVKTKAIDLEYKEVPKVEKAVSPVHVKQEPSKENVSMQQVKKNESIEIDPEDEIIFGKPQRPPPATENKVETKKIAQVKPTPKVADTQQKQSKHPVIESPEDLEKWLDDFLDG